MALDIFLAVLHRIRRVGVLFSNQLNEFAA
jgi:hypothetical protein